MAEDTIFINNALNEAFSLYVNSKDKEESKDYNSFLCCVVRMLVLIYGEDIVNYFEKKNIDSFDKEILKYDYSKKEYNYFKLCLEKFCEFNLKIENKVIKKKNKYFNLAQKYLIDMLVQKNKKESVSSEDMNKFYDLLFTANSKTFYQKSYAVLVAYNPYEIDEYAKKQNIVGDGNNDKEHSN